MSSLPPKLNFSNSEFAIKTIRLRWPVILSQLIDSFYRNRELYFSLYSTTSEQLKAIISDIAQLRYEITTDKKLCLLSACNDQYTDLDSWNRELQKAGVSTTDSSTQQPTFPTWHQIPWLFAECYLYRRINDSVIRNELNMFDPFVMKKRAVYESSVAVILDLLNFLTIYPTDKADFETFCAYVQISLWANEFDLSLHSDGYQRQTTADGLVGYIRSVEQRVVVNDLDNLWEFWRAKLTVFQEKMGTSGFKQHTTALVLDNAGPELVADLCLGEFLLSSGLTHCVRFYPKIQPWFVSDVTPGDVDWLLNEGINQLTTENSIRSWATKWKERFHDKSFQLCVSPFWTLPHPYEAMRDADKDLYAQFTDDTNVVLFKGDLNYRKIVGDRRWIADNTDHKMAAFRSLQWGRRLDGIGCASCVYHPINPSDIEITEDSVRPGDALDCRCSTDTLATWGPPLVVALRISKADVAVGLESTRLRELQTITEDWWTIGQYGLIQIVSPIKITN